MQLVGADCYVCNSRIIFAPEAASCPACTVAFHRNCLKSPAECPKCGEDFARLSEVRAAADESTRAQSFAQGRAIVRFVCMGLVVLQLIHIAALFAATSPSVNGMAGILVAVPLIAALYLGKPWARIWVGLSCGLTALMSGSYLGVFVVGGNWAMVCVLSVVMILLAASGGLLLFSERVQLFLDCQRSTH